MRVALSEHERRVYLDQGEALFDVRHDAERPFIVETSFGDVRARGTAFLVKIGAESARATVIRGVVEGSPHPGPLAALSHRQPVIAEASQEISFQRSGIESAPLPAQTLQRRLAWREGMLAFDGETLRDAAMEIERQTGVHFEFAEPSIGDLRIGGYISATDVGGFGQLIEENLHLKAERQTSGVMRVRRS
jgi:transmembrane sensor